MEQQLINNLLKLITLAGGGDLVRDLSKDVNDHDNPKSWDTVKVQKAVEITQWQIDNFGTSDAIVIVENLVSAYNLPAEALQKNTPTQGADSEPPAKVAGLQ